MFQRILVPLDGSRLAEGVLPITCALAERCRSHLTLLHLLERHAPATVHADRHLTREDEAEAYLRGLAARLCGPALADWHVRAQRVGDVGRGVVDHARELAVDLVAMTTHGTGELSRLLFGSIAQQVLARWDGPLLLLPSGGAATDRLAHFLVPVDLVPAHHDAVDLALDLARICGASVRLFGVAADTTSIPPRRGPVAQFQPRATRVLLDVERDLLEGRLETLVRRFEGQQTAVEAAVAVGDPAHELLAAIEREAPDLVIVASHRRRGLEALLHGSVGQRLAHTSAAPLLVTPA